MRRTVSVLASMLATLLAVSPAIAQELPAAAPAGDAAAVDSATPPADRPAGDAVQEEAASEGGTGHVVGEKPPEEPGALDKLIKSKKVRFDGSYGLHYTYMPTFGLDETGASDGLKHYLDHRLNLRPTILLRKDLELVIDVDLLAGQLAGSTADVASKEVLYPRAENDWTGRSMLRELKLTWTSVAGKLQVGQIGDQWGLGMIYNRGVETERDWNDNLGSDMVERLSFDAVPFAAKFPESAMAQAFHVMVAGDVTFKDDMADLMDDDHAYGFTGAVYFDWNPEKSMWRTVSGLRINYRWQDWSEGWNLQQTTVDLFSEHEFRLASGDSAKVEVEAAVTTGSSDRPLHLSPEGYDVLGWGFALRGTYDYAKGIKASLEFGAASGDSNQMDGTATAFAFDPSYQVGMILFQDVLARAASWSANRAASENQGYEAPGGWQLSLTNGSVTNALYIHPQFKFYPAKGLDMRLGFLWARALVPVTSYYNLLWQGAYAGGEGVSFAGGPGSKDLGIELDAGIYYTTPPIWKSLAIRFGLAGGWCLPGDVFDDAQGNGPGNLFKVRLGLDIVI